MTGPGNGDVVLTLKEASVARLRCPHCERLVWVHDLDDGLWLGGSSRCPYCSTEIWPADLEKSEAR